MEKEFIPYEQALALKELGFEEKCFGKYYYIREHEIYDSRKGEDFMFGDNNKIILRDNPCSYGYDANEITVCVAPIYQQVFRWFRDNYNLQLGICHISEGFDCWTNDGDLFENGKYCDFKTYEEAELACLKKLIEIVKKNENN